MVERPKILVTNDDGMFSDGLWVLARELKTIGDVMVVAPDREQSAIGTAVNHAIETCATIIAAGASKRAAIPRSGRSRWPPRRRPTVRSPRPRKINVIHLNLVTQFRVE